MAIALPKLFETIVASLDPGDFVRTHLREEPPAAGPITLLALGKAAVPMTLGARDALGNRISREVVVAPRIEALSSPGWYESDHPVPTARSERAARALLDAAADAKGPVLALVSGGGSSLAALPAKGLSLGDKSELLRAIYGAGANIEELNIVRKHLSAIKGGHLAAAARHPISTLVLSDVLGDSLTTIASGPTVVDPSTYDDALRIVQNYCGDHESGPAVEHLRAGTKGMVQETPKRLAHDNRAILLAGLSTLVDHAVREARAAGAHAEAVGAPLEGTVDEACQRLCNELALETQPRKGFWVFGGEPTIALSPSPGTGGRAQHLALLLAERIAGREGVEILVAGSDGIDGNSQAAGARIDGGSWTAMVDAGADPGRALASCDSGSALAAIGAQIVTGPTGVNHADLVLVQIS